MTKTKSDKTKDANESSETELKAHKFADFLPEMSLQELEDLKKSIETVGLQEPIVIYEKMILDGRNRYKACMALGITPEHSDVVINNDQEAIDFVITRNLQRRQLTAGQKAVVALKALPEIGPAVQEDRVRKIRDAIAANRIDGTRANLPTSGELEVKQGRRKEVRTTSIVGDLFGVSATYVRYAEALQAKNPELLDDVIHRKARLYDLYKKHCPPDTKGKGKPGPKPNPISKALNGLIKMVGKKGMPELLAKQEDARKTLADIQCKDKSDTDAAPVTPLEGQK